MADFNTYCEKKALEATENCNAFKGINLKIIKDKLTVILNKIGSNGMFDEYTKHDISHIDGVLKLVDKIVTEDTANVMTYGDWLLIVLAVYFHDMGMFIPKKEYEDRMSDDCYVSFRESVIPKLPGRWTRLPEDEKERYIYQDYVRRNHGMRIRTWLTNIDSIGKYGFSQELKDMVGGMSADIIEKIAIVCESHNLDDLDMERLEVDHAFGSDDSEKANLLFSAILLRTADLLHVSSDRTPSTEFHIIDVQDPISLVEWEKQKAVRNVDVKRTNDDGKTPDGFKPTEFEVQATFTDPEAYFSFAEYLTYAEKEIKNCHKICSDINKDRNLHYDYPWTGISRRRIEPRGFETRRLNFEIDKERILKLLMGHTLYNDSTVVIRELIQNGIDACRLFNDEEKEGSTYEPVVRVTWSSNERLITVQDNGTGMSKDTVFNHLLMVGSSRYQSEEFKKHHPKFHSISRFGIGLLTCFMISDDIDIYTKENGEQTRWLSIRNLNGNFVMRDIKDCQEILERKHGSTFKLSVRTDVKEFDLAKIMSKWIVMPEVKVEMCIDGKITSVGCPTGKEVLTSFMANKGIGCNTPEADYKVETVGKDGISVSCLLRKDRYTNIWRLATVSDIEMMKGLPTGICIEGIRVTTLTPGYDRLQYITLVNCKGDNAPDTNVSRTSIEKNEKLDSLLEHIYDAYLIIIGRQMDKLKDKISLSWASEEAMYLVGHLYSDEYSSARLTSLTIFKRCVARFPLFIVENGSLRKLLSIEGMPDKVITIENRGFNSACDILTEVKDSGKTAINIIKSVKPEYDIENGDILDYNAKSPFINSMFFDNFEIRELNISPEARSLQVVWEKGDGKWLLMDLPHLRNADNFRQLFVPLEKGVMTFKNDRHYLGVSSSFGFILLPNNTLWEWLISKYDKESEDIRENKPMLAIALYISSVASTSKYRGEEGLKRFFVSEIEIRNLSKDFDTEEIANKLPDSYEVFGINDYYRHFD